MDRVQIASGCSVVSLSLQRRHVVSFESSAVRVFGLGQIRKQKRRPQGEAGVKCSLPPKSQGKAARTSFVIRKR